VDQVRAPVYLQQGRQDTRTPARQADEYARRLRAAGGDVLLHWYDGGHEPVGVAAELASVELMLELAGKALRGERWSDQGPADSRH
jgi:predicted esterase